MPKYVHRNAYIAINGTALSDHCSSLTINDEADKVEFTSFSGNGYREFGQGLKDGSVDCTFFQDFAAGSVHAILQPLYSSGGTFAVEVRPDSAAASSTNPKLTFTGRLYNYSGFGGQVGDASEMDASFANAGTAGLVWGTV